MQQRLLMTSLAAAYGLVLILGGLPGESLRWDVANHSGHGALLLLMALSLSEGHWHRRIACSALALVALHAGLLLATEPLVLRHYLGPVAPLHMLSGLFAGLLLALVLVTAMPAIRRRLHTSFLSFRRIHVLAASLALAMALHHGLGHSLLVSSDVLRGLLVLLGVGLYATAWWRICHRGPGAQHAPSSMRPS
jgi:hypothetical protein